MNKYRRTKMLGAIEALQGLLDWGNTYHSPIDEDAVWAYLQKTKDVLKEKPKKHPKK